MVLLTVVVIATFSLVGATFWLMRSLIETLISEMRTLSERNNDLVRSIPPLLTDASDQSHKSLAHLAETLSKSIAMPYDNTQAPMAPPPGAPINQPWYASESQYDDTDPTDQFLAPATRPPGIVLDERDNPFSELGLSDIPANGQGGAI